MGNTLGGRFGMLHEYSRMELLLGEKMTNELAKARVAVFGIGGAGSYAAEALARCGIGVITLVDHEPVKITDRNRNLTALSSTQGKPRTQAMKERIRDIDPQILVHTYETFYSSDTQQLFDLRGYDYIIDAMDTLESKLLLIEKAKEGKTACISCMKLENRMNPARLQIADISRVSVCPMAKELRMRLQKKKIRKVKVLFSRENPQEGEQTGQRGSISYMYGAAGMLMAGEVIRDLLRKKHDSK